MNATEAAKKAQAVSERQAAEDQRKAAEAKVAARRKALNRKRTFLNEFQERTFKGIEYAVENGLFETTISLQLGDFRNPVAAEEATEKHYAFRGLMAFAKRLKKEGYQVDFDCTSSTYSTNHESSVPDYNYTLYYAGLNIRWGQGKLKEDRWISIPVK